ncbi:hypothetical protein [Quadrisphaera sp. INWT6]|uniref:hypothetical protein n=1 Tax=Quadrisphaera sp. INWT6 TaxID=2596917 RepID=UPI0018920CDF|nr:hypothetical protein [Quadrisphaera sp. INWT6]MBF5080953.1 hypothetical protein [Quadrisphaera sp. INWT6]
MTPPGRRVLAAASAALGALVLSGCAAMPQAATDDVRTLAKIDGWRADLITPPQVFSALEVAYDLEAAQRMWQENVPPGLSAREGDPTRFGVYGDLADVDFGVQAVALWSGGQSGSCSGWLSQVRLAEASHVVVTEDFDSGIGNACSTDRNVYRTVVVVERDQLPSESSLESAHATDDDPEYPAEVFLAAYPAS